MEHIPCPVCKTSGGVPVPSDGFVKAGSNIPTTGRCPLCWGVGHIPLLEAYKEKADDGQYHTDLALHYWECNCSNDLGTGGNISNYHPDTHEFCMSCHTTQDDGMSAVALLVQTWLAELGAVVEIEWVEQAPAEDDVTPAPGDDSGLVQNALFQAPVDTSRTDVYVLAGNTKDDLAHRSDNRDE